jgi:hypothetical protein
MLDVGYSGCAFAALHLGVESQLNYSGSAVTMLQEPAWSATKSPLARRSAAFMPLPWGSLFGVRCGWSGEH